MTLLAYLQQFIATQISACQRLLPLPMDRVRGVETGGCPHSAIRDDASMNLDAIEDLQAEIPDLQLVLVESGGDNLGASFSPELVDVWIYVIDVAARDYPLGSIGHKSS